MKVSDLPAPAGIDPKFVDVMRDAIWHSAKGVAAQLGITPQHCLNQYADQFRQNWETMCAEVLAADAAVPMAE